MSAPEVPVEEPQAEATIAETPTPVAEEPAIATGINEEGRAINDPRVEARPVASVEISTAQVALFKDEVAPAVEHSGRAAPRASNDPRGPLPSVQVAEAASGN